MCRKTSQTWIMYAANTAILQLRIFSGRYHFRLWVFALTGEYFYYWHWRVLPKLLQGKCVNDVKPLKTVLVSFYALFSHVLCILQIGSFNCGPQKSCWISALYYRIWLEGYQFIWVRFFSFATDQQAFEIKPFIIRSRSPRR